MRLWCRSREGRGGGDDHNSLRSYPHLLPLVKPLFSLLQVVTKATNFSYPPSFGCRSMTSRLGRPPLRLPRRPAYNMYYRSEKHYMWMESVLLTGRYDGRNGPPGSRCTGAHGRHQGRHERPGRLGRAARSRSDSVARRPVASRSSRRAKGRAGHIRRDRSRGRETRPRQAAHRSAATASLCRGRPVGAHAALPGKLGAARRAHRPDPAHGRRLRQPRSLSERPQHDPHALRVRRAADHQRERHGLGRGDQVRRQRPPRRDGHEPAPRPAARVAHECGRALFRRSTNQSGCKVVGDSAEH